MCVCVHNACVDMKNALDCPKMKCVVGQMIWLVSPTMPTEQEDCKYSCHFVGYFITGNFSHCRYIYDNFHNLCAKHAANLLRLRISGNYSHCCRVVCSVECTQYGSTIHSDRKYSRITVIWRRKCSEVGRFFPSCQHYSSCTQRTAKPACVTCTVRANV